MPSKQERRSYHVEIYSLCLPLWETGEARLSVRQQRTFKIFARRDLRQVLICCLDKPLWQVFNSPIAEACAGTFSSSFSAMTLVPEFPAGNIGRNAGEEKEETGNIESAHFIIRRQFRALYYTPPESPAPAARHLSVRHRTLYILNLKKLSVRSAKYLRVSVQSVFRPTKELSLRVSSRSSSYSEFKPPTPARTFTEAMTTSSSACRFDSS
ncbi:hypothetical protein EVAR_46539_1 [Eumeta japonica]|uniref:Uncharacterized protein n=1 Tax=Eumeta variegata TaxID=151549 RepID=A0A4C1XLF9_EUMVA|nr:hypothetical protein EVAR_46539_1 [Eumeta japonica]